MRNLLTALVVSGVAASAAAQAAPATLTLDDAIGIAKKNNPVYQQQLSGRTRATLALRSAYGAFMPGADASFGTGYRQGKQEFFGGVAFGATSDIISSNWGLNFNARMSASTVTELRRARANVDAAEADVAAAEVGLRAGVVTQFLSALQSQANAALQDSLLTKVRLDLDLAKARVEVGSGTSLDVKRAEVAIGQQQVIALRARNTAEVDQLKLFQQLGVARPGPVELVPLTTVTSPSFELNQLLDIARKSNPTLQGFQSRQTAAAHLVQSARGAYTPTVSLGAQLGGYTTQYKNADFLVAQAQGQMLSSQASCFTTDSLRRGAGLSSIGAKCNAMTWTPAAAQAVRDANKTFPFDFTSSPYNLALTVSLPLFDKFGREQRLQEAQIARDNARYDVRRQELQLAADVTATWTSLQAAYRTVGLQEQNAAAAQEALTLAQARYRVGVSSFVELVQARNDYERASTDRIAAIYDYHRAWAALENAVGRPLR
ncbi:MAG: TolC family protein [Gemmatimonadetes bacterium]|nr:TolC family protein [Gemmatimonadota bacterium]